MLQDIFLEEYKQAQAYVRQIIDFEKNRSHYIDQYLDTLASAVIELVEYGWYLPWLGVCRT